MNTSAREDDDADTRASKREGRMLDFLVAVTRLLLMLAKRVLAQDVVAGASFLRKMQELLAFDFGEPITPPIVKRCPATEQHRALYDRGRWFVTGGSGIIPRMGRERAALPEACGSVHAEVSRMTHEAAGSSVALFGRPSLLADCRRPTQPLCGCARSLSHRLLRPHRRTRLVRSFPERFVSLQTRDLSPRSV